MKNMAAAVAPSGSVSTKNFDSKSIMLLAPDGSMLQNPPG